MASLCSELLSEIVADGSRRRAILTDPRDLHRELFASFVPQGCGEYAGTYRGTPGTRLAGRSVLAETQINPGERYEFCLPGEVPQRINRLLEETRDLLESSNAEDYDNLLVLSYTFCWFGKVHPFLDGNGHIQRAIFAAMATELGYPLSPRFAIHPRPYGQLLATGLEIFSRKPAGQENDELGLIAEYLAFFLEGPFNAPRKHLSTDTP